MLSSNTTAKPDAASQNLNGTNAIVCESLSPSKGNLATKTTAFTVLFVMAFIGNILVIVLVKRSKRIHGAINLFIVNMAVSDLFVPLFVIPREVYQVLYGTTAWQVRGSAGTVLCKIVFFASDISPIVSVLTVCCITVERFIAIVFPHAVVLSDRRTHYMFISLTWFIALGFCAPYFYIFKLIRFGDDVYCVPYWGPAFDHVKSHQGYIMALCICFVIIPFILLAVLYAIMIYRIKTQRIVKFLGGAARKHRDSRTARVMKLAVTIVIAFALCWAPFNVGLFVMTFVWGWDSVPSSCSFRTFWFVALFMAYSNSAINPWIYFMFAENFKRGLKETFRRSLTYTNSTASLILRRKIGAKVNPSTEMPNIPNSPVLSENSL